MKAKSQFNSLVETVGVLWFRTAVFCGNVVCILTAGANAQDTVTPLLRRIPESANTIAVVRVQEILTSPKAVSEHWSDPSGEKLLFGSGIVPPWVDTLVVGSHVRLGTFSKVWSVGVLAVPPQFSLEGLAIREAGHVEELGGRRAVRGRRDAFFVDLGDRVLGVMSPAYRQEVARWGRRTPPESGSGISDYLTEAAVTPAQFLLAIDLQDSFDNLAARNFLNSQPVLKSAEVPVIDVVEMLKTLRGVRVSGIVDEVTNARISLDFGKPVTVPPQVLKALTIAMIDDYGLNLPELEQATATAVGKTFALDMENMSGESLRAILSLILTASPEHPANTKSALGVNTPKPSTAKPSTDSTPTSAAIVEEDATKRYLDSVNKIVDDLSRELAHIRNYMLTATWHENFASKIEHLRTAGVSPEVIEYGVRVSTRLRGLAASLRGVAVTVNVEQGTLVWNASVIPGFAGYGVWGYSERPPVVNVSSNLQEVRERQAAAVLAGESQREAIWNLIREDRNAMLRKELGVVAPELRDSESKGRLPKIPQPAVPQPRAPEPKPPVKLP